MISKKQWNYETLVCRDKNGFLGLYKEYPTWVKVNEFREDWDGAFMALLPKSTFPEVTFENSPQEVELKLVENNERKTLQLT